MSTATVHELRERLLDKATTDDGFRAKLIADPKVAIKDELGLALPDGFTVRVHEDAPDTGHLVLPPPAALSVVKIVVERDAAPVAKAYAGMDVRPHVTPPV